MIRILLAEDQALVLQGLKMMIETDPEMKVAGEAANGRDAVARCESGVFDIAVLDIRMPVMSGLDAARIIRSRWPAMKVLMLTTFNDDQYAMEAMKCGANGYMLKDAEPEALHRAIRSCMAGGLSLQEQVAAKLIPKLLQKNTHPDIDPSITARELDIMRLIGEGYSNSEISQALSLSVGTVKNHISVILEKLDLRDRTQLAIYAIRHQVIE
ncbi:response regulator [Paenibacillus sp. GCM10027627]|uniref:response regulator n=1 Tax=unclassified Paenibacillus TaxID=185978 RepID=UPI00362F37D0